MVKLITQGCTHVQTMCFGYDWPKRHAQPINCYIDVFSLDLFAAPTYFKANLQPLLLLVHLPSRNPVLWHVLLSGFNAVASAKVPQAGLRSVAT